MRRDSANEAERNSVGNVKPSFIRKKIIARAAIAFAAVVVASVGGFLVWASDYYRAEPEALAVLEQSGVVDEGRDIALYAEDDGADCAIVFYPGAKVQAEAYLPILDKIRDKGITCFLVRMPLNMAIFDMDAADSVMDAHPEIGNWYIAGHSMGGGMASAYASNNPDFVKGLILMGAYVYGDYPPSDALTIYGSLNQSVEDNIDYDESIVEIDGGNHAQFGNYGPQDGDALAAISAESQQDQAVDAIVSFIADRS